MPPPNHLQRTLQDAVARHRAGRLDQADVLYRRVLALAPRNFDALQLSGVIALQQGRAADAAALLARACEADPRSAVCAMRYGLALVLVGRTAEAEAPLRRAVALDPRLVEAWDNLAHCLKLQDRLSEAIDSQRRAVALKPDYAQGWYNLGLTLSLYGNIGEALQCHERAIAADPKFAKARYGRAQTLHQMCRLEEAIADYDRYLALEPEHHEARSNRLLALNNLDRVSREQLFAEHVDYGRVVGLRRPPRFPHAPQPDRRLRVGVLSPDLREHSCAYFIEPLLRNLDPARFELYLYHDHFREDGVSRRLQGVAAAWRRIVGQGDPAVERIVRADQPDILIDLAGHTGMSNRLPLFARCLAPVQITYLGYPNTTGVPAIGYRFTDAIADPPGAADRYATEKLVRFAPTAWAYQPRADAPPISDPPAAAAGAPLTFGCFNNLGKFTDGMLAAWGRILTAVPDARLVIKGRQLGDELVRRRYLERFAACGLPGDRVEFLESTADSRSHLALYRRIDIALDTFPYNGTTTTCEALWMGVPVITLCGDRHSARVGASLLRAAGHPEWIAADVDDYVRRAAGLAGERARLSPIRSGLRSDLARGPLLDHAGQAARFGEALRACWREWCERNGPEQGPGATACAAVAATEAVP